MKVLLLANTLPPRDLSGVGEQVLQLAVGLRARGHRVEVVGRSERGLGASKLLFPLTAVPKLHRAVRRFRPDVVQVHESDGALAAWWLEKSWIEKERKKGEKGGQGGRRPLLVALLQVSYGEERRAVRPLVAPDGRVLGRPGAAERRFRRFKAPLQFLLGRLTARLADVVLCPSRRTAEEVARDYGIAEVGVLPNVTGGLERDPEEGSEAAAAGSGEGDGDLLFVGRLRLRKGVEVLLEAMTRLGRRSDLPGPPALLVAGDGEHRRALERRARELGLNDRVRFLGRRSPQQVQQLLARCRALVVPSIYEGMPLVVLEAMAAGKPVVASAVSGIPEVVLDGETGWLVPPEDPETLAAALAEVVGRPEEAQRRGEAGRRRVASHYRPQHAAARWEEAVGVR